MRNKFDMGLMLLFLINTILTSLEGNYIAGLGWGCAFLTIVRIITNNINNDEKI